MLPWFLSLALLAVPLPGVPRLGAGSEIRVTTPNLRVVYLALRVTEEGLSVIRPPRAFVPGQPVAVVVRVGRRVFVFPGRAERGDVVLFLPQGRASLKRILAEVYHLHWRRDRPVFKSRERRWEVPGAPRPGY